MVSPFDGLHAESYHENTAFTFCTFCALSCFFAAKNVDFWKVYSARNKVFLLIFCIFFSYFLVTLEIVLYFLCALSEPNFFF